jgi:hypothetical protein
MSNKKQEEEKIEVISGGNLEYELKLITNKEVTKAADLQVSFKDTITDRYVACLMVRGMLKSFINENQMGMRDVIKFGNGVATVERLMAELLPHMLEEQSKSVKENQG